MRSISRIAPCLWFDHQAQEAAEFYCSIFPKSRIRRVSRYGEAGKDTHHRPAGSVMTVAFEIDGQEFTALNGGPLFTFTEAVSFQIYCDNQKELDAYWQKLGEGGDPKAQQCGWLKDKYGLSWQVVPTVLPVMLSDPDEERAGRVMNAMLDMKKIDIARLTQVYGAHPQQVPTGR